MTPRSQLAAALDGVGFPVGTFRATVEFGSRP